MSPFMREFLTTLAVLVFGYLLVLLALRLT